MINLDTTMNLRTLIVCIAFCTLVIEPCLGQNLIRTNTANIKMESDAPLELIKAESNNCQGILNLDNNEFAFRIFIKTFDGFNSPLQKEHFYENYMEVTNFPDASFSGQIIEEIVLPIESTITVRAKGELSIHGIMKERIIDVSLYSDLDGLKFSSEFEVPLLDHNIEIPNIVRQKIADNIIVSITGILR